jgi:serine beta-lactamase-like protein LACTB
MRSNRSGPVTAVAKFPAKKGRAFAIQALCCILLGCLPYCAEATQCKDRAPSVAHALTAEMQQEGIIGLSAAIALKGTLCWERGFGFADIENAVPATSRTMYRLASITKPITATAIMQLVEAGKIDLDVPIQRYLTEYPVQRWPVTVRQLLGHLAGVRHYRPGEENSTQHYRNVIEPLNIFMHDPLESEPGVAFLYTTYGYDVLGAIVQVVSGQAFLDFLRFNIFSPAKMKFIRDDDSLAIIPRRTRGYQRGPDGHLLNSGLADTSNKVPAGGLIGTPQDLIRFALAWQRGGLISEATCRLMSISQVTRTGQRTNYGLGWYVDTREGRRLIYHTGHQQGTKTLLAILPDQQAVVAIMANSENADQFRLLDAVVKALRLR